MVRKRKKRVVIATVLLVGLIVLFAGTHYLLSRRLTEIVENRVLPGIRKTCGIEVTLDRLTSSLIHGETSLDALRLGNPQGFSQPSLFELAHARIDVSLREILLGRFHVTRTALQGATLTIERNADGRLNIHSLRPEGAGDPAAAGTFPPLIILPIILDGLSLDLDLAIHNDRASSSIQPLILQTTLAAANIRIAGRRDAEAGAFAMQGHDATNPDTALLDIRGAIQPIHDPDAISFTLEGRLTSVTGPQLSALLGPQDIEASGADLDVSLRCRDGAYLEGSVVHVKLTNPRAAGKLARHLGDAPLAQNLTIILPVRGTLAQPDMPSLEDMLAANVSTGLNLIGQAIEKADKDGKLGDKIDAFLDKLLQ